MDYQDLHAQLKELEAQKAELENALHDKRADRKKQLLAEFKARIDEEGFDFQEICGGSRKRREARTAERNYRVYVLSDDTDCMYFRGPLPQCMKTKMKALGLDPAVKADRERFKADYMVVRS